MSQLADQVASAVSPSTSVVLNTENISSVDAASANLIESAMKSALQSHSFHLAPPGSITAKPPVRLTLTLSEAANTYVWVVRIFDDADDSKSTSAGMVSVSKGDSPESHSSREYLSLERRLVWKQSSPFLDFALVTRLSSSEPALVVLDKNQLAVYEPFGAELHLSHASAIPQSAALVSRDLSAQIDLKSASFRIANLECTGDPDLTGTVHCRNTKTPESRLVRAKPADFSNGVSAALSGSCAGESTSLVSGSGDWTQTDSIQGYLAAGSSAVATSSGAPLSFPGPVISLYPEPDTTSARAIVHNLKTGDYEAYIVTATCNH